MSLGVQNYNGGTTDEYGTALVVDRQMGSGVVEGLLVAANGTPNMTVYVQPGSGLIPTGTYPSSYNYRFHIDTSLPGASVTIGTAAASPRIDYIVAYIDKSVSGSTAGANVNNTNAVLKLADVQGTPAGSPSVPTTAQIQSTIGASNPYIILAQVAVGASVSSITNTNITDLRTFAADRNDAALGASSYVDSGLVWTATSGLAASMTAGKAYINVNGTMVPASAAAIASNTFTASQDTYVYINVNGVVGYSAVANNATSPSLPPNAIWLAIVVTNGSTVTSINIGQVGASAPTISGRILNVSDTNGNLIYPSSSQRVLGHAQTSSNFNTSLTTVTAISSLSTTITVTSTRRLKITAFAAGVANSVTGVFGELGIWNGTVGSGTQLAGSDSGGANAEVPHGAIFGFATVTPGTYTFNASYKVATGTATWVATPVKPAYIHVETE